MRFLSRLTIVLLAIVIFSGIVPVSVPPGGTGLLVSAAAQGDAVFLKATQLEKDNKREEALKEYEGIAEQKRQSDPETAAEALARAAAYATTATPGMSDDDKKVANSRANKYYDRLLKEFYDSKAAHNYAELLFQKAHEQEKAGLYKEAYQEYDKIVRANQRTNPEITALALYQGGLFTRDGVRYGGTDEGAKHDGQKLAVQMWKRLLQDFPDTASAKKLAPPGVPFLDTDLGKLESEITKRNSSDWRYQIISGLVHLTGAKPWSYPVALILLAFMVKLFTLPFSLKQYKSMREMQKLQPELKALKEKYKGDNEGFARAQMALFKEHSVNPLASCFPMLITLPFLWMVYIGVQMYEYEFAKGTFLWIGSSLATQYPNIVGLHLATPDIPLLVLYVVSNYITMRLTPATDPQQEQTQKTMALMVSGILFYTFVSSRWSSAFILYWFAQNLFSIWQQYHYVYQPHKERMSAEGTGIGGVTLVPETTDSSTLKKNGSSNGIYRNPETEPQKSGETPARVRPRRKKK